jgi:hypothetical protein
MHKKSMIHHFSGLFKFGIMGFSLGGGGGACGIIKEI